MRPSVRLAALATATTCSAVLAAAPTRADDGTVRRSDSPVTVIADGLQDPFELSQTKKMFYVTEAGKVMLDCIGGHYQLSWGYNHPLLTAALGDASDYGVVWDNHANTPSLPVKMLADRLVEAAGGAETGLNRALLGLCTGSVACEAALKIMLVRHARDRELAFINPAVHAERPQSEPLSCPLRSRDEARSDSPA